MPKFSFRVTENITQSAYVTIEADTIEEAHSKALYRDRSGFTPGDRAGWELDELSQSRPYIPDPDDYEIVSIGEET